MLQGKAVSRAVRGHCLLEVALYVKLLSSELDSRAFDGNDMLPEPLEKAKKVYESLLEGDNIDEAQVSEAAELIYEIVPEAAELIYEIVQSAIEIVLTNAQMKIEGLYGPVTLPTSQKVLDGDWLVQKIPWTPGSTYSEVAGFYVDYVTRHFGQAVVVLTLTLIHIR